MIIVNIVKSIFNLYLTTALTENGPSQPLFCTFRLFNIGSQQQRNVYQKLQMTSFEQTILGVGSDRFYKRAHYYGLLYYEAKLVGKQKIELYFGHSFSPTFSFIFFILSPQISLVLTILASFQRGTFFLVLLPSTDSHILTFEDGLTFIF